MAEFDSIDALFDKGFRIEKTKKGAKGKDFGRDKRRSTSGSSPASRGGGGRGRSPSIRKANLTSVEKKAPEVMVKITGSSKGLATARNHLDYISRNGDVELIDESGQSIMGNKAVRDYKELLRVQQIPEKSHKREFLHVIFSMPKDTPVQGMKDAVGNFCKEEFGNRRYVMAFHDDTDHRHVHVCVGTRDIDRADEPRLSPRKGDLRGWREAFAADLREQGIEAAASSRPVRFKVQKQENFVEWQRTKNGKQSDAKEGRANELAKSIKAGKRPENPLEEIISVRRNKAIQKWDGELKEAVGQGDKARVESIGNLLRDAEKRPASKMQEAFDKSDEIVQGESSVRGVEGHRD